MHRSFAWVMIAILAIMLAPFAGVLGVPASAVQADTAAPTAAADDEIIVITSALQLRVDDPTTPPGYNRRLGLRRPSRDGSQAGQSSPAVTSTVTAMPSSWRPGPPGSYVKVFDPVVQPGRAKVNFSVNLGSGRNVRLLVTGDFDADGKDEFAVMHYISGGGFQARLVWFDGGANATEGEWTRRTPPTTVRCSRTWPPATSTTTSADDLVMVRNTLLTALDLRTWSTIAEASYTRPWFVVAGG